MLVTRGFVSTGYQAHSSQGSLRTLCCGTPCTWDVVCGGVPAVPGVSFWSFRLFWTSGLRLLLCICKFGESLAGDKHDVTVLNVHRCFSQFCCFSSCGMSCVLSAPVGPYPRREEFCAVCLGRISKIKPLTFSVTLTSDLFVTVKFGRLSPAHSCCQRVLGCRITASSGRPHIGRMPQSECKFVA